MIAILIAMGFLAGIVVLWFTTKEECVKAPAKTPSPSVGGGNKDTAGKSADGTPGTTPPTPTPSHGDHDDDHADPVTIAGALQTVLGIAAIGAIIMVCFSRCERMAEHNAITKAEDRQSAANPDNYFWELWKISSDGRIHKLATGITRETSQIDGRVTLSWRSTTLNGQITANCIPGQKGFWEVVNGQGRYSKKDFQIYTVSNMEIRGWIDGSEEKYDFIFRRSIRKWN